MFFYVSLRKSLEFFRMLYFLMIAKSVKLLVAVDVFLSLSLSLSIYIYTGSVTEIIGIVAGSKAFWTHPEELFSQVYFKAIHIFRSSHLVLILVRLNVLN